MADDKKMTPFPGIMKELPIQTMFAAPLEAAIDAHTLACQKTASFIEQVGFTSEGAIRMVRVEYDEPEMSDSGDATGKYTKRVAFIPFIGGVVPIPNFGVDKMAIDFDLTVSTSEKSSVSDQAESKLSAKIGWGVFSASMSGSVSHKKEQTRTTDTRAKYTIHLEASRQDPPEAFMRIIDIITNASTRPIGKGEGTEPKETIGEKRK